MGHIENIERPSKEEQKAAMESYDALASALEHIHSDYAEVGIEETSEKIKVPVKALHLLAKILKETSQGKAVSILTIAAELTTQAAAEILGCSRPHVVKLLETGEIRYTK